MHPICKRLTLVVTLLMAIGGANAASAQGLDFERLEAIADSAANAHIAGHNTPGLSVAVAKGGEIILSRGHGTADLEMDVAASPETVYMIGSITKQIAAATIMRLVEAGKISIDDPLAEFVPDFPSPEAAERIQIEHLLSHTSGLGSYFNEEYQHSSRARFRTVDDFMELARGDSLRFEPGTRSLYSNTGFLVLGKVIEEVTGQSYFDYVAENIYAQAGMTNTDAFELDRVNENLAVGYEKERTGDTLTYRNNIFEHVIKGGPAGGGYSTVRDLLRFAQALRNGELLGQEYVELLLSPKPELNSPEYGFGFGIDPETRIAGHSGGFMGISSNLDMFLEEGYTAVVLSNYGGASQPVVQMIRRLAQAGGEQASAQ